MLFHLLTHQLRIRHLSPPTPRCGARQENEDSMGPVFIREPPNRLDFSNTTGAEIECSARGNPPPEIIWIRADGTAVGDVPGLRQVR
ncbi:hypothetical protein J437_LFUL004122 [Ladona fulva]|uniref:Ig-like domain-containing protein n=1 Tax=Ladona fulva TaxID=123851 RepID=A0A8K0JWD8_LADFU|nr:hypothetical protein J437_LFUL004122 [Ladona fulva]